MGRCASQDSRSSANCAAEGWGEADRCLHAVHLGQCMPVETRVESWKTRICVKSIPSTTPMWYLNLDACRVLHSVIRAGPALRATVLKVK